MAEEKISEEEVLDDAELENVAGGTVGDSWGDAKQLHKMGKLRYIEAYGILTYRKLTRAINQLGKDLNIDIGLNISENGRNSYSINGKQMSRDEFWKILNEAHNADKK